MRGPTSADTQSRGPGERECGAVGASVLDPIARALGAVVIRDMTESDRDRIIDALASRWYGPPAPAPVSTRASNGAMARWLEPLFESSGECLALHLTYRESFRAMCYPGNVVKDCRRFLAESESCFGRPAGARLIGVEKHPSGRDILHAHILLGGEWSEAERFVLRSHWTASRGWCVVRPLLRVSGAVLYCAKHHLKQGGECAVDAPLKRPRTRYERRHPFPIPCQVSTGTGAGGPS